MGVRWLRVHPGCLGACAVAAALGAAVLVISTGCPSAVTPVTGPALGTTAGVGGNSRPVVQVLTPSSNLLITEGENVTVVWSVNDTAGETVVAGLKVVDILTNQTAVNLVVGQVLVTTGTPIQQTSTFTTAGLAGKTYLVTATASDGVNPVQQASALGTVQVVPAGTEPTNAAPRITLLNPEFDQSVAQGDTVILTWNDQDVDSNALIILALDLDQNPTNDNPFRTDEPGLIILGQKIEDPDPQVDPQGVITNPDADAFEFKIDVSQIPIRPGGQPYFPRATITDGANPAVHSYSAGRLFVTRLAESAMNLALGVPNPVDLSGVGQTTTGATLLGFNPGAYCGSRARSAGDFDADGADDFVLVSRFGRPHGYPANVARGVPQGSTGEAYLIYGHPSRPSVLDPGEFIPGVRYGGRPNANSTSTALPGVIFAAPPPDPFGLLGDNAGITDFCPVPDQPLLEITGGVVIGDGRPELVFGLAHHNGVIQARDDDPADTAEAVEFIVDSADATTSSGDSYTSSADQSGLGNCFKNLLVVDADQDDDTGINGPFIAYFTFTASESVLSRMRALLQTPGADVEASLVLFINEPGDDMDLFAINLDQIVDPCAIPAGGFDQMDLVDLEDVTGADIGEVETDVADLVAANILGGRESFSFALFANEESAGDDPYDTVRIQSAEGFNSPRLEIRITQEDVSLGCYPDPFSNNLSDSPPSNDPGGEDTFILEFLGFVTMISSENRDCDGIIDLDRWNRDSVRLDAVGQEGFDCPDAELTDLFGARWQSTLWDWVDHLDLEPPQPPVEDSFGQNVDSMPDLDNDQIGEIIISAPTLELDQANLLSEYGFWPTGTPFIAGRPVSTHAASRAYFGSVFVQLGADFNDDFFKETEGDEGNATFPNMPNHDIEPAPACGDEPEPRVLVSPGGVIQIFAEDINDRLGGARYAGDFNQDFSPDIVMGAPLADPPGTVDGGKAYVLYGRVPVGDVRLSEANTPGQRPPMLRIFGDRDGDQLGLVQGLVQDFNGDGLDDVVVASKFIDFDGRADSGAVGLIFGGQEINGDRQFSEIGTPRLRGLIFYGDEGHWAGADAAGAGFFDTQRAVGTGRFSGLATGGDFNGDGLGDLLIAAPGEVRTLPTGQQRQGVVYLIFGNPRLFDPAPGAVNAIPLSLVGTSSVPGIVFVAPYEPGTLDADGSVNALSDMDGAPNHVGWLGDINDDGFDDVMIGNTRADFVDPAAPDQRRPDAGEAYLIYGNNLGRNNPINW